MCLLHLSAPTFAPFAFLPPTSLTPFRKMRWSPLASFALVAFSSFFAIEPTRAAPQMALDAFTDAQFSVNREFADIPPITCESTTDAAALWLDKVGEVMERVALGGLMTLPPNAVTAIETISSIVVSTNKLQNTTVLTKVLAVAPAIWKSGYWYMPIETWQPLFTSVWNKTVDVANAKRKCVNASDDKPYAAAINATALMIRFTKDNYFLNGQLETDGFVNSLNEGYLTFLPQVVARLVSPEFTLSETQLRVFMSTIPSKKVGMDMSAPFSTYIDTAKYAASDAAALRAFLSTAPADGTPAQSFN